MRELNRFGDGFPTITVRLNKGATSGSESWIGYIPFNTLYFDHRAGKRAFVGMVLDVAVGGATQPGAAIVVTALATANLAAFSADFDPRLLARPGIALRIDIQAGTGAIVDLPVIIYCLGLATDTTNTTLPNPNTNTTVWTVKDFGGATIPTKWTQL